MLSQSACLHSTYVQMNCYLRSHNTLFCTTLSNKLKKILKAGYTSKMVSFDTYNIYFQQSETVGQHPWHIWPNHIFVCFCITLWVSTAHKNTSSWNKIYPSNFCKLLQIFWFQEKNCHFDVCMCIISSGNRKSCKVFQSWAAGCHK